MPLCTQLEYTYNEMSLQLFEQGGILLQSAKRLWGGGGRGGHIMGMLIHYISKPLNTTRFPARHPTETTCICILFEGTAKSPCILY